MFEELAKTKGVQIFYATHSPDFINTPNFENIVIVKKEKNKNFTEITQAICDEDTSKSTASNNLLKYVRQLTTHFSKSSPTKSSVMERLRNFYRSEQNEAFFARKIVLVEGESEFFSLPIYASSLGYSFNKEGITIVNCGSKNNIQYFYHLFADCFQIPTFVMFDGDKIKVQSTGKDKQDPKQNTYLQQMLKIDSSADVINSDIVEGKYAIFCEDFENFIRSEINAINTDDSYEKMRQEAKEEYGGNGAKWFTQRYIAMKMSEKIKQSKESEYCNLKKIIKNIFHHNGA
jgi:putative ATP-dependent endonuclease of the OLD family